MSSVRPFGIAAALGFSTMIACAIVGNLWYAKDPTISHRLPAKIMMVLVFGGLAVFAYSLVPLLVRGFIRAQIGIGNGEAPAIKWLVEHERATWLTIWGIWSAGLALGLPFAIRDWSRG